MKITIYALMDGETCLYVGQTYDCKKREAQHRNKGGKIAGIPHAAFRVLKECEDSAAASESELEFIRLFWKRGEAKMNHVLSGHGQTEESRAKIGASVRHGTENKVMFAGRLDAETNALFRKKAAEQGISLATAWDESIRQWCAMDDAEAIRLAVELNPRIRFLRAWCVAEEHCRGLSPRTPNRK